MISIGFLFPIALYWFVIDNGAFLIRGVLFLIFLGDLGLVIQMSNRVRAGK